MQINVSHNRPFKPKDVKRSNQREQEIPIPHETEPQFIDRHPTPLWNASGRQAPARPPPSGTRTSTENRYLWRPSDQPTRNVNNDDKPPINPVWFWVFGIVFVLILIIAVIAIVLGFVLPTNGGKTSFK